MIWHEDNFKIPVGFSSRLGGRTITDLFVVQGGLAIGSDTTGTFNAFTSFLTTQLTDRGWTTDLSPIRYEVTGTAPDRIFKLELFNAGFKEEHYSYGTLDDSVNVQYWLYETSDIFEIRYGSAQISHPSEYFLTGLAPLIGYIADLKLPAHTVGKLYFLKGGVTAPVVDSATTLTGAFASVSAYPASGTVYRFEPNETVSAVPSSVINDQLTVFPTRTSGNVTINYKGTETLSIAVRDMNGREWSRQQLAKGSRQLDLSCYAAGVYMLDIKSNDGRAVYKVVKE